MTIRELFEDIDALKHTERQGWKDKEVEQPRDTIASHSFGAALIGWTLSEKEDVDTERVIKMLLMHDLIMAYIDDVTPEDKEFDSKKEREQEMAEKLFQDVPDELEKEFRQLFHELQERETEESKIAKEADKLDTLLQAESYSEEGENFLPEFLDSYRKYFRSRSGSEIFRDLEESGRD